MSAAAPVAPTAPAEGDAEPASTGAFTAAGVGQGVARGSARVVPLALARLALMLGLKKYWAVLALKKLLLPFFSIPVRRFKPRRAMGPLEVLRLRHPEVVGTWKLLRHEFRRTGWTGTLAHVSTPLGVNVLLSVLMFTSFRVSLEVLSRWDAAQPQPTTHSFELQRHAPGHIMVAGILSGCVQAALTCPVDQVRLSLMNSRQESASFHSALRHILDTQGPRALFRGLSIALLKEGVGVAVFFGLYEVGRRHTLALLACPSPDPAPALPNLPVGSTPAVAPSPAAGEGEAAEAEAMVGLEQRLSAVVAVVVGGGAAGLGYRAVTHPLENIVAYQHRHQQPISLVGFFRAVPRRQWAPLLVRGFRTAMRGILTPAILGFVLLEALD
eukprot:EG_transcript_16110